MQRRPLCFLSILLISCLWILRAFGLDDFWSDAQMEEKILFDTQVSISGQIYNRECKEDRHIYYLKQAVLLVSSRETTKLKNVRITCEDEVKALWPGDYVQVTGKIKAVSNPTNPGQFDMATYYDAKKVGWTMWNPTIDLQKRSAFSLERLFYQARLYFAKKIEQIASDNTTGIFQAMILGEKGALSQEIKNIFQAGGISHILAISGLHLTILAVGCGKLFRIMRVPLVASYILQAILMCTYGFFTGAGTATLRALILFLLVAGARLVGRTPDGPTSLAIAAILLLSDNPDYLWYSGFIYSFLAVLSFLIFHGNKKFFGNITLFFCMAPALLYFSYELPLYTIVLNLMIVPTVGVVLASGILGCMISVFSEGVASILLLPGIWLIEIYEWLCKLVTKLPFGKLVLGQPQIWQIFAYYITLVIVLFLFRRYRLQKRRFLFLFLMLPAFFILTVHHRNLEITFLDVGQGDCIFVGTDSTACLIDGGSSTVDQVGQYRIEPFLKSQGISVLDLVFVTHGDADHTNGIEELLTRQERGVTIQTLILPEKTFWDDTLTSLAALAQEHGTKVREINVGEQIYLEDEISVTCIWPDDDMDETVKGNEASLVLSVAYEDFSMLCTGDLEGKGESEIEEKLAEDGYTVLKVAHHGSRNSTSASFLSATNPSVALISAGQNNWYGHPHTETIDRLKGFDCAIFNTQKNGAITLQTNGTKMSIQGFCKEY